MYTYNYLSLSPYTHTHTHKYIPIHTHTHIHINTYKNTYIYIYIHVYRVTGGMAAGTSSFNCRCSRMASWESLRGGISGIMPPLPLLGIFQYRIFSR